MVEVLSRRRAHLDEACAETPLLQQRVPSLSSVQPAASEQAFTLAMVKRDLLSLLIRKKAPDKRVGLFEPGVGELTGHLTTGLKADHNKTRTN